MRADLAAILGCMPHHVARVTDTTGATQPTLSSGSWAVLSGRPAADHNLALIGGDRAEADLRALLETLGPCAAIVQGDPADPAALTDLAEPHGLRAVGQLPLMTLPIAAGAAASGTAVAAPGSSSVSRVSDAAGFTRATDLIAETFSLETAAMDPELVGRPGVDIYVLEEGGTPLSALVLTRDPGIAGIWAMATPERHARRGYGRRLIQHVLDEVAADGPATVFLGATPAGRPLYEALGFTVAAQIPLYLTGASTQFG